MSVYSCYSYAFSPKFESGFKTVKNLLSTAIAPVGSTLYVWGGGWNDNEPFDINGPDTHIGIISNWAKFYELEKENYKIEPHENEKIMVLIVQVLWIGLLIMYLIPKAEEKVLSALQEISPRIPQKRTW